LGFLTAGIIIGTASAAMAGLSIILGLCICGFLYKKHRYRPVFFFVLFLAAGMARGASRMVVPVEEPAYVYLQGWVVDTGGLTAGGNQRAVVRDTGSPLRLMVYIPPHLPRAEVGQGIYVSGELLPLARAANPGGYDAFLHLRTQKIDGIIRPDAVSLGEVNPSFYAVMRRVRDRIAAVYDGTLPARDAGVVRSIVLGDREDLDRGLVEIYRVAGIRHLLSISGLHVTVLTVALAALLGRLMPRRRAGLITLAVMILYCLMTGAAVATVRAVMMGGVLVFARVLYREYDLLATVSWACVALLLYEPLMLFNVGFQLSFGAVYGIAVLTAPIERLLTLLRMPAYGKFREGLAVSMAASFSTYIVFAHHFYEIPLYSVFANVVVIPLFTLMLVLGVVTGLVGLVWLPAATVPAGAVFFILRFYGWVGDFVNALPFSMVRTGGGNVAVSLAGVAVLLIFAYVMNGFGPELKRRVPVLLFGFAALLLCLFIRDYPLRPRVTELDTPGNYAVHRYRGSVHITGTGRGGEAELTRYLNRLGVNRACGLELTAWPRLNDLPRLAGVMERIYTLYLPGPPRPLPEILGKAIEANGVEVIFIGEGT
jgi:ComEC/Rec2-related protein